MHRQTTCSRTTTTTLPSRGEVAKMSMAQFNAYVEHIKATREITQEERDFIHYARRSIKNRAYALESRAKRKEYIGSLEATIIELREKMILMQDTMQRMKAENTLLRGENAKLCGALPPSTVSRLCPSYTTPDMIWCCDDDPTLPLSPLYDEELMTIDSPPLYHVQ